MNDNIAYFDTYQWSEGFGKRMQSKQNAEKGTFE